MKGIVYIMTNENNSVLYTGVTRDLKVCVTQHKLKKHRNSFSARYNICKLVYYENIETIGEAIKREKQIKSGSRKKKIELINGFNPEWIDLSSSPDVSEGLLRRSSSQ
jgi:putative endonuclease